MFSKGRKYLLVKESLVWQEEKKKSITGTVDCKLKPDRVEMRTVPPAGGWLATGCWGGLPQLDAQFGGSVLSVLPTWDFVQREQQGWMLELVRGMTECLSPIQF